MENNFLTGKLSSQPFQSKQCDLSVVTRLLDTLSKDPKEVWNRVCKNEGKRHAVLDKRCPRVHLVHAVQVKGMSKAALWNRVGQLKKGLK